MLGQPCVGQSTQPWMVTHVLTDPCAHQLRLRGDDSTKSSRMLETLDGFVALHVTRKAQHRSSRPQSIRSNQCPARLMPFLFAPSSRKSSGVLAYEVRVELSHPGSCGFWTVKVRYLATGVNVLPRCKCGVGVRTSRWWMW